MPIYPDDQTLRLRAADRRRPAEAVALTARELARRPAATRADVRLAPADRALVSFRERYPAVAERFHPGVLWSAAHGHAQPAGKPTRRPCGWDLARAWSRRHGGAAPRVDRLGRLLLGDPCPSCQAALGWHPPKPQPKPARRSSKPAARKRAGSSTAARSSTPTRAKGGSRTVRVPALLAAAHPAGVTAAQAKYNREAMRRLGMDPATAPHLTRAARR
jgi:hypothetical protein